jgi:excisionase family DNA binding protein
MAPDREQQEVVYTIAEVARILKVSEQLVRGLIERGELKYKRIGRQYRITREMLDEYLKQK